MKPEHRIVAVAAIVVAGVWAWKAGIPRAKAAMHKNANSAHTLGTRR